MSVHYEVGSVKNEYCLFKIVDGERIYVGSLVNKHDAEYILHCLENRDRNRDTQVKSIAAEEIKKKFDKVMAGAKQSIMLSGYDHNTEV